MIDLTNINYSESIDEFVNSMMNIVSRHVESLHDFKYLQFFTFLGDDGKTWLEAITLFGQNKDQCWWRHKIEKEFKNVKWLSDSYDSAKEMWESSIVERMISRTPFGICGF